MEDIKRVLAVLPAGKLYDRAFAEAISPAAEQRGARVTRFQPDFSTEAKLGALCQEMEFADLVLIDISARNPHTMYWAGYAHGIGRKVLFLAQHGEEFPFDPGKHPAIIYGSNLEFLKTELASFLQGEQPAPALPPASGPEDARAKFESIFGDITNKHGYKHPGEIYLENPTTFVLVNQDMELALVQELARRSRELGLRLKLM